MDKVGFLEYKKDICKRLHTIAVVDLRSAERLDLPNCVCLEYEAQISIYALALIEIKNELSTINK
jgi:hypothetical protein